MYGALVLVYPARSAARPTMFAASLCARANQPPSESIAAEHSVAGANQPPSEGIGAEHSVAGANQPPSEGI
eukprot:1187010-Prorocentrum_minimum.AAC.2